ncbi:MULTISPECIES: class I SAM-dependent methyltransferase [Paenibacillus]|uniref:class I SAM-dependent methyltransferase n=1 Tax=Paenibacillus TaxID=44249 RepID=UPI0022B86A9D|nr:class I SAM-dependent methyltransferase [Paenibacillus caseinilyticus]MCZ8520385.1 class I SAM-dependent methyltransferase [Paenibacillus caseinilyticus]
MTETDSKERFTERVENYVLYRPDYPAEALDYLYGAAGLQPDSEIADVGAGTGKFSKLLLARGSRVTAVEPNEAMRTAADQALGKDHRYRSVPGSAEDTGLPASSVDFIVCAQAFHWFDRRLAQAEFARILKPGGRAVLIWNSRLTHGTPFLEEYDKLLHVYAADYAAVSHKNISEVALGQFFQSGSMQVARFPYRQLFDYEGLRGRLLSSSYAPAEGHPNHEPMLAELRQIFDRNAQEGRISFEYETEVYSGEVGEASSAGI